MKDRVQSLPHISQDAKFNKSSEVSLSKSFCSVPRVKTHSEKALRNFIQENIRNISSRKVSRLQDSAVSCPDLAGKVCRMSEVEPHVGKGKYSAPSKRTTPKILRQVKFNLGDVKGSSLKRELVVKRDVVPSMKSNHSFHSIEPLMSRAKMFEASNATISKKKAPQVLNIDVEKHEKDMLVLVRDDVRGVVNGLKAANEEALKVCLDLKSSCRCLRQICGLLKEVCVILRDGKY